MTVGYYEEGPGGLSRVFLVLIALFIPWVSVMLVTGCGAEVFICILFTCLFWFPGFIYAVIIIYRVPSYPVPVDMGPHPQQLVPIQSYQYAAEISHDAAPPYTPAPEKPAANESSHHVSETAPMHPHNQ